MKRAIIVFIILLMISSGFADDAKTPESLAGKFVAVVNAKKQKELRGLIHPKCFTNLSLIQKQFIDETNSRAFQKIIPESYKLKVSKLEEGKLPFADMMEWQVNPTHQIEIEFSTGEYSSTSIIRFIVKKKDQWFLVIPMLNKENMKEYEKRKTD